MSPPLIEADGLAIIRNGVRLLDDISFALEPSTALAIIGPSGTGKTQLLRVLTGLDRPSEGTLRFEGAAVTHQSEGLWRDLRRTMGIVLEGGALLHDLTVAENLALPLMNHDLAPAEIETRLEHSLISFGLDPWRDAAAAELSPSLSKRAQLARALIRDPRVLICDAPFEGLDPEAQDELVTDLGRMVLARRVALLMTARNGAHAARLGATMLHLERGRLRPAAV